MGKNTKRTKNEIHIGESFEIWKQMKVLTNFVAKVLLVLSAILPWLVWSRCHRIQMERVKKVTRTSGELYLDRRLNRMPLPRFDWDSMYLRLLFAERYMPCTPGKDNSLLGLISFTRISVNRWVTWCIYLQFFIFCKITLNGIFDEAWK
jgi:hypothetical protein